MGMRVTTNMAMNLYRYNLGNSTIKMNDAMNKVMTHRKFDSFGEDPSSAIQAWRIRRAMVDNASYQNNNSDTTSRFRIAWESMLMVSDDLVDKDGRFSDIRAMNDATAGAKVELGRVMSNTADSVIQAMNSAKFGDHFVFSGNDEMNAPFTWSEDGKTLYYRGVNVNAGLVKNPAEQPVPSWALDDAGNEIPAGPRVPQGMPAAGADADEQAWINYYMDPANNTEPTTAVPAWAVDSAPGAAGAMQADDGNLAADAAGYRRIVPEGIPAKSDDIYEQAWIEYYQNPAAAAKPTDDPGENGAWGEADQFGVPAAAKEVGENHGAYERMWAAYYRDQGDVQRLDKLAHEAQFVDLGMGLKEDGSGIVNGTAFDRSLPGIDMLGYGIDKNGDPNNVAMVLKRLGEIFQNCDPESGKLSANEEECEKLLAEATRLLDKLKACKDDCSGKTTEIDTKASFLEANADRMKMNGDYLNVDRAELEDIDPADAISNLMYDYYCYNAALKVGTQLLSQSLIDYMN